MKLYKYESYDQYKQIQTETNIRKINNVWIDRITVKQIKKIIPQAKDILCHGVRNAKELLYFSEFYPDSIVIGTEISETASQFTNVIQWDFHDTNPDWIKKFDIVYSNSWDHSYDPIKSMTAWKDQIHDNGTLIIEHGFDVGDNKSRASDPLEIYDDEIVKLINDVGLKLYRTFETTALKKTKKAKVYIIKKI